MHSLLSPRSHVVIAVAVVLSQLVPTTTGGISVAYPEEYVNVLAGATGQRLGEHHSTGNTLPIVARPWGFNHWAPETTDDKTSWWADMQADTFRGIRCTHQPSPWIGDYGQFLISPFLGFNGDDFLGFTSYFAGSAVRPFKIDLTLGPYDTHLQFSPTNHGGIVRTTFHETVPASNRLICVQVPKGKDNDEDEKRAKQYGHNTGSCESIDGGISLISKRFSGGVPNGDSFNFYARFEASSGGLQISERRQSSQCYTPKQQFQPMNMPGQDRSVERSAKECQTRCRKTSGCAHFTFWDDGGCHIQDANAKSDVAGDNLQTGPPECPQEPGQPRMCCFELGDRLEADIHIGTSFISDYQSRKALHEELRGHSLESVVEEGREVWRNMLSRISVLDAGPPVAATWKRLEMFYTCLYRVLLFPRRLDETTDEGVRHWSPYDGRVHEGPGVTDNGFWDTFRTVYPLLSLAYPKELGEILQGWLNAYKAGNWLPKWASPGYRDSMVGTFADVVLADAILKNISGFDHQLAWEAMKKDSFEINPDAKDTARGKFGLKFYQDVGYIPMDSGISEACSRTLDFAFADAATAAAALRLGFYTEAGQLKERSLKGLRSLFHNGLMGHRLKSGWFKEEPSETWGDCFTEGSSWHHSFPPFNIQALVDLYGGKRYLLQKLESLFNTPSAFGVGSYKVEIHEMREMRMLGMGQYAHNNQPVHHLAYLFARLGDHSTTASLVRRIMDRAYSIEGFAGDEDNGEMGAWFVLSALGLYALAIGVEEDYTLGAIPYFPRIWLRDLDVIIEAPSAAEDLPKIRDVSWRSRPLPAESIPYSLLRQGGVLRFAAANDTRFGHVVSELRGTLSQASKGIGRTVSAARDVVTQARNRAAGIPSGNQTADDEPAGVGSIICCLVGFLLVAVLCRRSLGRSSRPSRRRD